MYFAGHTRFSVYAPNRTSWVASRGERFASDEEYREYLFSPERLEPRADIFFNYSLPMLERASRGHEFIHVVAYSPELPEQYRARLRDAARRYPFLILSETVNGATRNVPRIWRRHAIDSGLDPTAPLGLVRLDDDDLLSGSFFDQAAQYVTPEHVGYVVTLARGYTALYAEGRFHYPRLMRKPLIAIGHMSICQWSDDGELRSPVGGSHASDDSRNPVILDSRAVSYMWVRSPLQDSGLTHRDHESKAAALERLHAQMSRTKAAPVDAVTDAIPVLAGRITPDWV